MSNEAIKFVFSFYIIITETYQYYTHIISD